MGRGAGRGIIGGARVLAGGSGYAAKARPRFPLTSSTAVVLFYSHDRSAMLLDSLEKSRLSEREGRITHNDMIDQSYVDQFEGILYTPRDRLIRLRG
jgi:hypothetical protein